MNKKIICSFELIVMIVSIFSFSYMLNLGTASLNQDSLKIISDYRAQKVSALEAVLVGLFAKLKEPMIPLASAAEVLGCCAYALNGDQCATTTAANCEEGAQFAPYQTCLDPETLEPETSFCRRGCCFDDEKINFDEGVLKTTCDLTGQNWQEGSCNNIPEARKGCCVVGPRTYFENIAKCTLRTAQFATGSENIDWDADLDEFTCYATAQAQPSGACVFEDGLCRFQTQAECFKAGGSFNENKLCTDPSLETICEKTSETTCIDGESEVYFVDSCGNHANIYDSSKVNDVEYWTSVVSVVDSCDFGATDGNANSKSCGNCEAALGGTCAPVSDESITPNYGEFYCRDTTCEFDGERYENGESWCVYDGKIGEGNDLPGSRHWRYACSSGQVEINPCADMRGEICVQSSFADEEETIPMKNARCELNEANTCFRYNNDEEGLTEGECAESFEILDNWKACLPSEGSTDSTMTNEQKVQECNDERAAAEAAMTSDEDFDSCLLIFEESDFSGRLRECDLNSACFVNQVDIDDDFKFDFCTPQYPIGFDINNEGSVASAEATCGIATTNCIVQYEPKTFGGCKLVSNGNCLGKEFTEKMNNLCRGLGDCGADVNYLGEYSPSYDVTNAPVLDSTYISNLIELSQVGGGESAEAVNPDEQIDGLGGNEQFIQTLLYEGYGLGGKTYQGIAAEWESKNKERDNSRITGSVIARITGNFITGLDIDPCADGTCLPPVPSQEVVPPMPMPPYPADWDFGYGAGLIDTPETVGVGGLDMADIGGGTNELSPCATGKCGAGANSASGFSLSSFATAAMGAAAGYFLGQMLAEELELSEGGSLLFTIGSSLVGSSLATLLTTGSLPGIGTAILAAGIILMIIGSLFGGDDCDPIEVQFECKPWQPVIGGNSCEECNGDPNKPCSEYRCSSLGTACVFINEGSGEELCIEDDPQDATPPTISRDTEISTGEGNVISETTSGFEITSEDGGCLDAYTDLTIGLVTDEPSWCKADTEIKSFDEMSEDFGSNIFAYEHSVTIPLQDPSHGESHGITWSADTRLYIKCIDRHGIESVGEYTIGFCVNQGEDATAPIIRASEPANGELVGFDDMSEEVKIMTNELSTCKWDSVDKDYSLMSNSFECNDEYLHQSSVHGYVCEATLPTTATENKFYIRCMDQPWLEERENEDKRIANLQGYEYILEKPVQKIEIDYVKPENDFESSVDINHIQLEVKTSNGGSWHQCYYSVIGYDNMIAFFETGANKIHRQSQNLLAGEYKYYIKCEDETGDFDTAETNFKIIKDTSTPQIARVWKTSGNIYIITTEEAECKYSTSGCGFSWSSGNSAGNGLVHTISSTHGQTYSIKCMDEFGNVPSGCSIQVRSS